MPRFKPLPENAMSEAQRAAVRELTRGLRGTFNPLGPNALLLRSPNLMSRTQKVGEYLRFESVLPRRLRELAILITARKWTAQLEWKEHSPLAIEAGIDAAVVDELAQGKQPQSMRDDESAVYRFCTELHETQDVSDAAFQGIAARFGEEGVIDLIGLTGYYTMLAMVLNVGREPLPNDAAPPLGPLPPR